MDTDDMIDWFLLEAYAAGEASPADRLRVEEWLAEHPDNRRTLAKVQAAAHARRIRIAQDWRRAEAIDAVMARVRAGEPKPVAAAIPTQSGPVNDPVSERLMQRIRRWFEGATELAAAMLLDNAEPPLTEDEVAALRERIDRAKRDES